MTDQQLPKTDHRTEGGAAVALSGGQDSTTCLYYALKHYDPVAAVSFDYGQRHRIELDCAAKIALDAGVPHTILSLDAFAQLGDAALTSAIPVSADAKGTGNTYAEKRGLPSTFVPGRNIILLGLAAAYGVPRDLPTLVTGVCAMDDAGYPDCRASFISSLEHTVKKAMDLDEFVIDAPLLHRTKAQTWKLAAEVGALDAVVKDSHTCYEGDHDTLHAWGYGCGECPACQVRADGWDEYQRTLAAA